MACIHAHARVHTQTRAQTTHVSYAVRVGPSSSQAQTARTDKHAPTCRSGALHPCVPYVRAYMHTYIDTMHAYLAAARLVALCHASQGAFVIGRECSLKQRPCLTTHV